METSLTVNDTVRPLPNTRDLTLPTALNQIVRNSLPPAALGLSILYAVFALGHALLQPQPIAFRLTPVAAGTSLVLFGLYCLLHRFALPAPWAHPLGAVIIGLALVNSSMHLALVADPQQTTNFMLLAIGAGSFFLSTVWLTLLLGMISLCWSLIAWGAAPSAAWSHFGFALLSSIIVAGVIHAIRVRTLWRLERLRLRDETRKAELEAMVVALQASEEELRQVQTELERRVEKRTAELAKLTYTLKAEIDERRQIEAELRSMSAALENAVEGIALVDQQGNYLSVNRAYAHLLGYEPSELKGVGWQSSIYEPDRPLAQQVYQAMMNDDIAEAELRGVRQDGSIFYQHLVLVKAYRQQEVIGYYCFMKDVSEPKQLREQLLQSEKLSAIGQLIAGVAHELNNPLTSVLGYAQLLQANSDLPANVQRQVITIANEALRTRKIIQNLLTFARRSKVERNPVKLNQVVETIIELRRYELKTNNIEIVTKLPPNLPRVIGDFQQLQQVVLNLLTNAEQAIKESGRPGTLTIEAATQESNLVLRLQDTGPGIPAEYVNRIFEPFFTTKPVGQGTGLGLAICYGIISEHGGTISVESQVSQGTTFNISLPVSGADTKNSPTQEACARPAALTKRILAVDDEPYIRNLIEAALTTQGHRVDTAESGDDARQLLAANNYDLVLSDMRMPGMNGKVFYRHLCELRPELAQRVIFVTGDTVNADTVEFLERIGCASLTKPFLVADLIALTTAALNQPPAVEPERPPPVLTDYNLAPGGIQLEQEC